MSGRGTAPGGLSAPAAGGSTGAGRYPRLFSGFEIGRLRLKNRIMVPAMTTSFGEPDGSIGERLVAYLRARALGGYGVIVTENMGVHPAGRVMPRMVMADHDRHVPGLRRLAAAVHDAGGLLVEQLSHAGRQTRSAMTGHPVVAPSPIPCPLNREMPRELTVPEIASLERAFVDAAARVAGAGFDGLEIHGAHGYLVAGFLSPYSNKRADEYGGTLENRMRFLLNVVAGIQRAVGRDFPLIVRISADEFVEGGIDVGEAIAIARRLARAGIHALSASVGVYESFNRLSMVTGEPEGQWLPLAGQVRKGVDLPVIGVGRIKRARVAEEALAAGLIDVAAFGRASIADPDLPAKIARGRERDVMWCLGCNVCLGRSSRPEAICPVNPEVGREQGPWYAPTSAPRTIRVVGTALAALTAAWVAARRGHRVELAEDEAGPGGMQGWRARVRGQQEYAEIVEAALRRALAAGARFVTAGAPSPADAVWRVRRYQPVHHALSREHPGAVSSYDVLAASVTFAPGARVAVLGDDLSSAEAAIRAADGGAIVTLFTSGPLIAADAHPGYREASRAQLSRLGAEVRQREGAHPSLGEPGAFDRVVVGHAPDPRPGDARAWSPGASAAADAFLDDAYEPGAMTSGVYAAFELAARFAP